MQLSTPRSTGMRSGALGIHNRAVLGIDQILWPAIAANIGIGRLRREFEFAQQIRHDTGEFHPPAEPVKKCRSGLIATAPSERA